MTALALQITRPVVDAQFPFNEPHADVILRSSDNTDFRVYKNILSLASPFFRDLFSLPQPPIEPRTGSADNTADEHRDGLLVIPLAEDAQTVEFMLRSIYPVRSPKIEKLSDLRFVLEASRKYDIEAFDGVAEQALVDALEIDPVGVYAIACRFGLLDIARQAIPCTLEHPIFQFSEAIQFMNAEQYRLIVKYHYECGFAATKVVSSRDWFSVCGNTMIRARSAPCSCYVRDPLDIDPSNRITIWMAPAFVWHTLDHVKAKLLYAPSRTSVMDISSQPIGTTASHRCGYYDGKPVLTDGIASFRKCLATAVAEAVAKASYDISICSSVYDLILTRFRFLCRSYKSLDDSRSLSAFHVFIDDTEATYDV